MERPTDTPALGKDQPDTPGSGAAFSGAMPRAYEARLVPLLFTDYADDLALRVGPVARGAVLEIAAGTGVVSRRLRASLAPDTRLTVSDVSPDMLALAREALADAPAVQFVVADATSLPFGDGTFDAVVCQFGVMFFPDEAAGYGEAARVLTPGGRFLFSVWDDLVANPLPGCVQEAFAALAPADPPRFLEKPYRPLHLTRIVRDLQAAGFGEIRATVLPKPCRAASASDAVEAFVQSTPLGGQLAQRALGPDAVEAAKRAVAERFARSDQSVPFSVPMRAVVFEAFKAQLHSGGVSSATSARNG